LQKILIIQTAFIGDVVLATGIVEKLHQYYPDARIDFLLRKGNEGLLVGHPFINRVLVWDKKGRKYADLWRILKEIRSEKYDLVVNLQRFASSGLLTGLSGTKKKYGFDKNPFSFLFTRTFPHVIGKKGDQHYSHEIDRNHELIREYTENVASKPKLYPAKEDYDFVNVYKVNPYITIAPASVWFTKQYPKEKWVELIHTVPSNIMIYLTGGKGDITLCEDIKKESGGQNIEVLAGKLSFLQTAALMKDAVMNYTNDSAPMHFASAMDAPVTAVYCSTIPEFGFGPLSSKSNIAQISYDLECRPCGLHGYKACPRGHFKCALDIKMKFEI
jgi:ADP-heptose:LPS heptosyltransferase